MLPVSRPLLIFLSCLILIVGLMAMDFINPSLPYIMKNLSASQNATKGLMVVYILAMSFAQLLYGTFSDNYGRRRAILIGFMVAIVGFILSALSKNIQMLYVARFITALGLAGSPVIARALIADVSHDHQSLKKGFAYFAMFSQLSPALSPSLGGIIQHYASWRISFFSLGFITFATLIFLYKIMPESHTIPAVKTLVSQQLLIYLRLLTLRYFMVFCVLSSLTMTFTLGFYSLMPFIFHHMGINALINGLMSFPYASGVVLGAFGLSTFFYAFDSEKTFKFMIFCMLILFMITLIITVFYLNLLVIGVFAFIMGFMCGNMSALSMSLSMQGFQSNIGAASAIQAFIRYFFAGLGLLCCNFIELKYFYQLVLIFLAISIIMLIIYNCRSNTSLLMKMIRR